MLVLHKVMETTGTPGLTRLLLNLGFHPDDNFTEDFLLQQSSKQFHVRLDSTACASLLSNTVRQAVVELRTLDIFRELVSSCQQVRLDNQVCTTKITCSETIPDPTSKPVLAWDQGCSSGGSGGSWFSPHC